MDSKNSSIGNGTTGPLKGVRIIDLSAIILGPYATQILGDLGAEIIKIEDAGGDMMRFAGNSTTPRMGPLYMRVNRNKQSVELNLRMDSAKQALAKLVETADAFFTNIRPEGLKRLGIDYEWARAINPEIVYVQCVGFGSDGPYSGLQAFDDTVQAAAGMTELIPRSSNTESEPRYLPILIADKTAGLHAVYATIAGLFHRLRTGEGQFIEVPMFESLVSFTLIEHMYGNTYIPSNGPISYPRIIEPNRKPYKTKDSYISIVPYRDDHWIKLFELAGRSEVMSDPRFATFTGRTENISQLYEKISEITVTKTTAEWMSLLEAAQIACMPVASLSDMMDDRHLQAVGFFEKRTHPTEGLYVSMKHPVSFSRTPADVRFDPPRVGEHNVDVLRDAGFSDQEIEAIATERDAAPMINA
jgi:crotonobetainyl-CoA:carnitine CoA-transferase CaiB-like acyl-CoA transferase